MRLQLLPYQFLARMGKGVEPSCGYDRSEDYFSKVYRSNAPLLGCTLGRYSSRINDGRFQVAGQAYEVACNDHPNHLHGGIWKK